MDTLCLAASGLDTNPSFFSLNKFALVVSTLESRLFMYPPNPFLDQLAEKM